MSKEKSINALVVASMHLFRDSEGQFYSPAIYSDDFFKRYLDVFGEISLIAKVRPIDDSEKNKYIKINTTHIQVYALPWYQGMRQMLPKVFSLMKIYRKAANACDCYIFRVLQIESMFAYLLRKRKNPYVVEVVNDPAEWNHFGTMVRKGLALFLKRMINRASGASYVTQYVLQQKYPRKNKRNPHFFTSHYSSVELLKEDIAEPKQYPKQLREFKLVHVANAINGNSKGHKTVLNVVKKLRDDGCLVTAKFIGDGPSVNVFKDMAKQLEINDYVTFAGRISERKVLLEEMRGSDLFLFPTYSEGLPRCVIEACAMGTPCLSTPVAGIPELLDGEYLYDPEDVDGFVEKIKELMNNPHKLNEMSRTNIDTAQKYEKSILTQRRQEFYHNLLSLTE